MATFTKPADVPRWADTSGNIIEPPEAKKDAGWLFQEIPPSPFENWKEKLNGDWWKWIDERFIDTAGGDGLRLADPAGPVQMASWVGGQFIAGLAADGMTFNHGGNTKSIEFDSSINAIRYLIASDTFEFRCGNAAESMTIGPSFIFMARPVVVGGGAVPAAGGMRLLGGFVAGAPLSAAGAGQGIFGNQITVGVDSVPAAGFSRIVGGLQLGANATVLTDGQLYVGDRLNVENDNFYLEMANGGNDPRLSFNATDDAITLDVSTGIMGFEIGGAAGFAVYPQSASPGGQTFVGANSFLPGNTGDVNALRYEAGARNAIQMQVKGSPSGGGSIIAGSRPWNIDSVELVSTGQYRVHPTQAILNYSCPVAGINGGGLLGRVIAFHSTASYIGLTTISSATGTVASHSFNLMVTGG